MRMDLKKRKSTWSQAVQILRRMIQMKKNTLMGELLRGKEKKEEENLRKIIMRILIKDKEFKAKDRSIMNIKI